MKVTVLQPGARHNYMQSRFLERRGMLQRLYTDFALPDSALARIMASFVPGGERRGKVRRRMVPEIPRSRISLFPQASRQNRIGAPAPWPITGQDLGASDVFFTQYYSGGHGLRERIRADAKIVADIFTVPSTHKIVNAECERFPEWQEAPFSDELSAQYESFTIQMLEDSDALFCPAQSVINDIANYDEAYRAKCFLVPYGSSLSFPEKVKPESRRILFAGTLTLRKGPQYVKEAARILADAGQDFHFVFAGGISEAARAQIEGPNIEILGHIPKQRMAAEYARADVFVLPSLAEGSAGVVLEAMSAGLPVVVTRNSGVDFANNEAGIYVPERSGRAIADALLKICHDRALRAEMSRAALERAAEYDNAEWEETFVSALCKTVSGAV